MESLVIFQPLTALMALTTFYMLRIVSLLLPMEKEKDSAGQAVNGIVNTVIPVVTHSIWKDIIAIDLK